MAKAKQSGFRWLYKKLESEDGHKMTLQTSKLKLIISQEMYQTKFIKNQMTRSLVEKCAIRIR